MAVHSSFDLENVDIIYEGFKVLSLTAEQETEDLYADFTVVRRAVVQMHYSIEYCHPNVYGTSIQEAFTDTRGVSEQVANELIQEAQRQSKKMMGVWKEPTSTQKNIVAQKVARAFDLPPEMLGLKPPLVINKKTGRRTDDG